MRGRGGEPWVGRWAAQRLRRTRSSNPAALLDLYGLSVGFGIGLFGLSPLPAAAGVTVVFALAHVYQGMVGVLGAALLGAILAALVLSSESLLPAIVLHLLVDVRSPLLTPARA